MVLEIKKKLKPLLCNPTGLEMAVFLCKFYSTADLSNGRENNDSGYQYGGRQRMNHRMRR